MTDKHPYDMSDEELEAAFLAAKAEQAQGGETTGSEEQDGVDSGSNDNNSGDEDDVVKSTNGSESDDDAGDGSEADEQDEEEKDSSGTGEADGNEEGDGDNTGESDEYKTAKVDGKGDKTKTTTADSASSTHKFRANGKEYEITDAEMKEQFGRIFGQAMDYTKKMQAIAPYRKTIDALEQAGLKHDDVNLLIDVLKGDKAAVASLLKRTNIDPIDINQDDNSTYTGNDYGRDGAQLDLKDVLESIQGDAEYPTTYNIIAKQWDEASWKVLSGDPEKIELLHIDVKSGMYEKLQPAAQKLKVFDNARKSDLDYYLEAAREYYVKVDNEKTQERENALQEREQALAAKTRVQKIAADTQKRAEAKEAAVKRKAAATTGRSTGKNGPVDYLNASDEDFDEWYKKLEER